MIHYLTTHGIGSAWVAAELHILGERGIPYQLHSLRPPNHDFFSSDWAQQISAKTRLIYPLPVISFLLSQLVAPFLFRSKYLAALGNALFGKRESMTTRIKVLAHFFVACHLARRIRGEEASLFHAQWAHSGATVAMYAAWLLGKPFSFTGHAVDLFQARVALADKVRRADFIVCISSFHRDFYQKEYGADPSKLHIVYCGIDVDDFDYRFAGQRDRSPVIVSVGRLVEKKGLAYLIEAIDILAQRGVECSCIIAGDGPLEADLRARAESLPSGRVEVTGKPILQENLSDFLAAADLFAQPCVWSSDNDVDGTPRTLMEAMATGLPSVSTRIAGIPDIIESGESGLLVEPESADELAEALQRVIESPELAAELSRGGRARIEEKFRIEDNLEPLEAVFRRYLHSSGATPARAPTPDEVIRA
jgi:colanic acid/amylovoran biosynthesis glycosyltransferase